MAKTNIGQGKQALALSGGGVAGYANTSGAITFTATTVTPTTSPSWTASTGTNFGSANVWQGYVVIAGAVYGVVTSNSATALTVDRWYNPATPTGAAGTTPAANTSFVILPGNAPCYYMAIGTGAAAVTDIALAGEQTTNGLQRVAATFAHTFSNASANNTYTLTNTFTYSTTGSLTLTIIGIFDALTSGIPLFTSALSSSATVAAVGDAVTCTDTVTM